MAEREGDEEDPRIGAAILAAGGASRFGGGKLWAELHGRPLIEHALDAYTAVPAIAELVVVAGADADELAANVDLDRTRVVVCDGWQEGIAASLRAAVCALAMAGCRAAVIGLGDQPLITAQVVAAVIDMSDAGERPARATFGGAPGHPVVIPEALFGSVERLRGDVGARELLEAAGVAEIEVGHLCGGDDVDTKADLQAIRERLGAAATGG